MTEPFADEHAPEVAASGAAQPSGVAPDEPSTVAPEEPSGAVPGESSAVDSEEEVVDGFPVLTEVRTVERVSPASLPAVQAAAAAATGFVAGAATVALVKRRHARKLARTGRGGPRRAVDMLPIVGSRSFLVDVHVIGKQGD
ncbi:MAG TPA: hypothetical protein VMG37_26025 [Solirubrobacteraceae bacterium]|nr:hypothetical protein [Solirubrobacteraceae bacterium]